MTPTDWEMLYMRERTAHETAEIIVGLRGENAKLRELSESMLACILATSDGRSICWECPHHRDVDELRSMCFVEQDARALGVEAGLRTQGGKVEPLEGLGKSASHMEGIESDASAGKARECADEEIAEMQDFCKRVESAAKEREELELFGTAYMPLPFDADGETVRIGDVMDWPDAIGEDNSTFEVAGIGRYDELFYIDRDECHWTASYNKRHHREPTVEDVLDELMDTVAVISMHHGSNDMSDEEYSKRWQELLEEYAERLQLKEDA